MSRQAGAWRISLPSWSLGARKTLELGSEENAGAWERGKRWSLGARKTLELGSEENAGAWSEGNP